MEDLFYSPRFDHEPFVGIPPPVERADGEEDPGSWALPLNLLSWPPELLGQVPGLGRLSSELSSPALHWTHSLPVRTWLPASSILLFWRTIRYSIHRLLVPRESGTPLTINYSGKCAGARWQQTFEDPKLLITNLDRRSGCQQETSVCSCPAGSSRYVGPSPSPNKSTRSPTRYNSLLNTEFILPSMFHYSSHTTLLVLPPQSLARQRNSLFLWFWRTAPSIRSTKSWTPGAVVVSWNT